MLQCSEVHTSVCIVRYTEYYIAQLSPAPPAPRPRPPVPQPRLCLTRGRPRRHAEVQRIVVPIHDDGGAAEAKGAGVG